MGTGAAPPFIADLHSEISLITLVMAAVDFAAWALATPHTRARGSCRCCGGSTHAKPQRAVPSLQFAWVSSVAGRDSCAPPVRLDEAHPAAQTCRLVGKAGSRVGNGLGNTCSRAGHKVAMEQLAPAKQLYFRKTT